MNILRRNRLTGLFIVIFFIISCNSKVEGIPIVSIIDVAEVGKKLSYSKENDFTFGGQLYSLKRKAVYNKNGEFQKVIVYYPEGIIEQGRKELLADKPLAQLYNFPLKQNWLYLKNKGVLLDKDLLEIDLIEDTIIKVIGNSNRFLILRK